MRIYTDSWDGALDFGYKGTRCVQSILRELSRPSFGDKLCCICGNGVESFLVHLCVGHPLLVCNESPTTIIHLWKCHSLLL